jgi:hypothetical protein
VEDTDRDQLELDLGMEPIELARARFNCRNLGRLLVHVIRRCLHLQGWAWIILSVLSMLAGGSLIGYSSLISEKDLPEASVLLMGVMIPKTELDFYSKYLPRFRVSNFRAFNTDEYEITISIDAAKILSPPVILLSGVDQDDCSGNTFSTRVKKDWADDVYERFPEFLEVKISMVELVFVHEEPERPIREIWLSCFLKLRPHKTTYSDRRLIFHHIVPLKAFSTTKLGDYEIAPKNLIVATDFEGYDGFNMIEAQQLDKSEAGKLNIDINTARLITNEAPDVILRWRDTESVLLREVALIIAGALFGLAGAFLVEWLKVIMGERNAT